MIDATQARNKYMACLLAHGSASEFHGYVIFSARLVRVASEVKRSPNKLRKIPGMQNFARGRRSLVIDQITKKYKRIAEKKNRLS
ncbi:hypothetical protein GCK32_019683 [Trichostrongylus colubriformis]|uniref:Uncharacterized protein n=1 Tax=Trichostrongylus colubriformis TaxID=6319 RepID=A0AAN8FS23_TRICO